MKTKVALFVVAGAVIISLWTIASFFDKKSIYFGSFVEAQMKLLEEEVAAVKPKCGVSRVCQPGHFVFRIRSGAANTVGPKICFDGKMLMSEAQNNVGRGLNVVVVNGKTGDAENVRNLNGSPQETLAFLRDIKPGMIVLIATYDDASGMTNEIRQLFTTIGSTKVNSLKFRDNWVFATRTGRVRTVHYEKLTVNKESSNLYEGWPEMAEVDGCFSSLVGQNELSLM